jgi:hypothetical protein
MTLIFSLVTDPFVVQVSDRRLTFPDGTLFEDEENKCIFYRFQGAVAYTGLARLGFEPTADWALLPLAQDGRIAWALGSLKSEASAKFRSLRPPPAVTPSDWRKIKRTTFVCAGYQRLGNPGQFGLRQTPGGLYPFCDKVTNTEQPPGGAWSAEASDDFYDILYWLQDFQDVGFGFLTWSGADLRDYEKKRVMRLAKKCLLRTREPEPVARVLARQIREVHERQKRERAAVTVGRSVMCAILRRPDMSVPGPVRITSNQIPLDTAGMSENDFEAAIFRRMEGDTPQRFIYYPGDPTQRTYYQPNSVTDWGVMKGGVMTW